MRVKEYLPSIDVLNQVYKDDQESLAKKIQTLENLSTTISNQVATTQTFRQDVQETFLEVSNAVDTVHSLWQTMTTSPAFSNESLELSDNSGQLKRIAEKIEKLDALVSVVKKANEMDLELLKAGIKDLHRCGSGNVKSLMENLEKAQIDLQDCLDKKQSLISKYTEKRSIDSYKKGLTDNKIAIFESQVAYLIKLAAELAVKYQE